MNFSPMFEEMIIVTELLVTNGTRYVLFDRAIFLNRGIIRSSTGCFRFTKNNVHFQSTKGWKFGFASIWKDQKLIKIV